MATTEYFKGYIFNEEGYHDKGIEFSNVPAALTWIVRNRKNPRVILTDSMDFTVVEANYGFFIHPENLIIGQLMGDIEDLIIEGIETLTDEQVEHIYRVNDIHRDCVGNDYKADMLIKKVWVDEAGITCVKLKNGEWYHYLENGTWY